MRKTIDTISWLVTEPEYRQDPALSYSQLSRFEKNGRFDSLETLNEHLETPSLTFGSAVDAICTGGMDEFNEHFLVVDSNLDNDTAAIIKEIYNQHKDLFSNFEEIPIDYVSDIAKNLGFWPADKWSAQARYNGLLKKGNILEYWEILKASEDKTVINMTTYEKVLACVDALKTSEATRFYFGDNDDNLERVYQLKFKATFDGIDYRCMADEIIVDHDNKTIQLCDLKTSSKPEYLFPLSYIEWNYQLQNRLYARIIKQNIENDDYFKDFKILDYIFIVINKLKINPLVWRFGHTFVYGDIEYGNILMRDPFDIAHELKYYLENTPKVPIGINNNGENDGIEWIKKHYRIK